MIIVSSGYVTEEEDVDNFGKVLTFEKIDGGDDFLLT